MGSRTGSGGGRVGASMVAAAPMNGCTAAPRRRREASIRGREGRERGVEFVMFLSGVTQKTTGQEIIAHPPVDCDNVLHRSRGETPVVRDAGTREGTQGAPAGCLFELAPAGGGVRSHTPVSLPTKQAVAQPVRGQARCLLLNTPVASHCSAVGPKKGGGTPKKGREAGLLFGGLFSHTPLTFSGFLPAGPRSPPSERRTPLAPPLSARPS